MGFGKHSEETYVEVLRYHPGYAQWCARTATSGSGCEAMVAFVNYLSDVERPEIPPRVDIPEFAAADVVDTSKFQEIDSWWDKEDDGRGRLRYGDVNENLRNPS